MIKYRKKISMSINNNGECRLRSDQGSEYQAFAISNSKTPFSDWWTMQHQSDLRLWQKDVIRDFATRWLDLKPYVIYRRQAGHNQPHDMAMAHSQENCIWVFSTERDFWITPCAYGEFDFDIQDSMGSILLKDTRLEIYKLIDSLYTP